MEFRFKRYAPPGNRWFYQVPETGMFLSVASSMKDLLRKLEEHYRVNKITIPENLEALVEHYMCLNIPAGFCVGEDPRDPADKPLTFYEAIEKMEKFFRGSKYEYVYARTAMERAMTCKSCPMNSLAMCTSCNGLQAAASRYVGKRKLAIDSYLGLCRVLRLPTNAIVHLDLRGVLPSNPTLPKECWVVTEANKSPSVLPLTNP